MTDGGYLIWIVAMAIMTMTVLTLSTLAAAGMLARGGRGSGQDGGRAERAESPRPAVVPARTSAVEHRDEVEDRRAA